MCREPFKPLLCMAKPRARRAGFPGFLFNLGGKRSVGNPRPLAGDGLSIRSAQGRVWSTQEPAKPAVHTLVVWAAGLSTRACVALRLRAFGCLLSQFFFQPPAGAAGGPPVEPCTHGSTPVRRCLAAVSEGWGAGVGLGLPRGSVSPLGFVSYRCRNVHLLICLPGCLQTSNVCVRLHL